MPRSRRNIPPDSILHVINRGNDRRTLFRDASEYEEFLGLLRHAAGREPLRLLGYVLMPNHWHLVVWPESGTQLSRYLHLVATVHAARWRRRVGRTGEGHVYQDRYHAFMIESERQFFNVLRYVEANPIRAGLVTRSVEWPWSSLAERLFWPAGLLTPSPFPLPPDWLDLVELGLPSQVLADLRERTRCAQRTAWEPSLRGAR